LLRIDGEAEYPVPPLVSDEAVALFCARSGLAPSEEIRELCRRLDDMPLAVELAAARTSALTPLQLLERLSQRLDLLKGGRDKDPRQQTLRATIEWSYELLTPEEQQLFTRLAVFGGGCTLEAAEEVADADLDALQSLVDKSLLRFTNGRYWMLETIRELAWERLTAEPRGCENLERRHAAYFTDFAERSPATGTDRKILEALEAEQDNFRATLRWVVDSGEDELGERLVAALAFFWLFRGFAAEGDMWAREVVARSRGRSLVSARALTMAGELARHTGDRPRAIAFKQRALDLYHALGQSDRDAAAAADIAHMLIDDGDFDRAEELGEHALRLRESIGSPGGIAHALAVFEHLALALGDFEEAARYAEACVDASVRTAHPRMSPTTSSSSAMLAANSVISPPRGARCAKPSRSRRR
jgi:tetratricopeptide (TPR) repeat protein